VQPRTQFLQLPGLRLRYLDEGAGEALLLIHGSYGSLFHWQANVAALAAELRVIAMDLPGFGGSVSAPRDAGIDFFADSVIRLAAGLGIFRFSVAAFSFGALVGARLALAQPACVRRLILVSPPLQPTPSAEAAAIQDAVAAAAREQSLAASVELMVSRLLLCDARRQTAEVKARVLDDLRRTRFRARPLVQASDLAADLAGVSCPVLVLLGANDPFFRGDLDAAAHKITSAQPAATVQVVDNAAHWLCFDSPDAANGAALRFLRQDVSGRSESGNERQVPQR
jgi:2-hydroxy-6-oxonona-2,4-dienedioate hydrolase